MPAPTFPGEPPSEPPYLNPSAHWYLGDASFLFQEIVERCGIATAKFLFQECIRVAEEQEQQAAAITKADAAQQARALAKLPTLPQIATADREQICRWWARLPTRMLTENEKEIVGALAQRYVDVRGYPKGFDPTRLPPIKKKGAKARKPRGAELPAMFDALKLAHPKFSKPRIAERIFKQHGRIYGKNPETIARNESNWRKKIRKV